jgi:UDP-glucose 4-epimerase
MKAVVFGGSGFVGSHVADELVRRGHEVVIFDIQESRYLREGQTMVKGDILDAEKVREAVKGCEAVYNFAGIADLDDARTKPMDTIRLNILGNANILEACVKENVKRFVYASTVYVYSSRGGFYRCSKQAAELYIEEFAERYGLDFTILRYGTLYGPRADEKNSIYRYVKEAFTKGVITCPGTGEEIREYINVRDAARLTVDVLDDKFRNEHVIITGHHPTKFMDMLNTIKEMMNNKVEFVFRPKEQIGRDHYMTTPYSFTPKIGKKLVTNHYTDLGQGLLECINDIQRQSQKG